MSANLPVPEIEGAPESGEGGFHSGPRPPRRRSVSFVIRIVAILLFGDVFVCATLSHFWRGGGIAGWWILSIVLTLTFVAATLLGLRHSSLWLRLAYRISVIWLGFLNFAFLAACAVWFLCGAMAVISVHARPEFFAVALVGSAFLASIYGLINGSWLRVTRVTVALPNLPGAWQGSSVALLTDLHLGNVRGAGFSRRVVARLRKLQADAVFISGDLFDGTKADLAALVEPFKELSARAGVFFVTGNHEEFADRKKYLDAVSGAGIRVLNNERIDVSGLQIIGMHDGETRDPGLFRTLLRQAGPDPGDPVILLAHQPSNIAIAEAEGVSLMLCGHTHGGQIWPWTLLAARVHGRFNHGLNRFGKMLVFTSYGTGTWGVPMRVGTGSEIVLIRLEAAS